MKVEEIPELMRLMECMAHICGECPHPDKYIRMYCKSIDTRIVWIRTARAVGPLPERTFVIPRERALELLTRNEQSRQRGRREKAKAASAVHGEA